MFDLDALWLEGREFSRFEAWLWLLSRTAWGDHSTVIRGEIVELRRGDVPTSAAYLAAAWNWTTKRVRTFLAMLERDGRIARRVFPTSRKSGYRFGTVYVLPNYDSYQRGGNGSGQGAGKVRANRGQLSEDKEATKQLSKKKKKRAQFDPSKVEIPPKLASSPAFVKAWLNDYVPYRQDSRHPLTEKAVEIALRKCAKAGADSSVEAIEEAILSGWRGLFPKGTTQRPLPFQPTDDSTRGHRGRKID